MVYKICLSSLDLAMFYAIVPKKFDYVIIAIIAIVMSVLINHKRHGQIDYLEQDLHGLMSNVAAFAALAIILEGAVMDEGLVVIALLRCSLTLWLGVMIIHTGLALYESAYTARTDNILLQPDPMQETADLVTCIGYLAMSMMFVAINVFLVRCVLELGSKKVGPGFSAVPQTDTTDIENDSD